MNAVAGTQVSIILFARDLRVTDHPALAAALTSAPQVLPLFVFDPEVHGQTVSDSGSRWRAAFLAEALRDLDASLRRIGGRLALGIGTSSGDEAWAQQVLRVASEVGAARIHVSQDVGPARARLDRLAELAGETRVEVVRHPGATVVPPGQVRPAGGGEYKVFGAYYRAWAAVARRPVQAAPARISLPDTALPGSSRPSTSPPGSPPCAGVPGVELLDQLLPGTARHPGPVGGETAATERLELWTRQFANRYDQLRDDLAADATSHLSPHLALGCLSPNLVVSRMLSSDYAGFIRQLAWRDFFYQVLAARPDAVTSDYRDRGERWRHDDQLLETWCTGNTGYPVVDAGMRQLLREGFMHNRARMVVASFLTKDLYLDWRFGAEHFSRWLLDADPALNQLNWQWVAGTGTDTSPNRIFNPTRQGKRFDPDGSYIRRYVPELASLPTRSIHDPDPATRRVLGYPNPVVDHAAAIAAYRARSRY